MKRSIVIIGIFCLVFAGAPAVLFGIFNAGVILLAVFGVSALAISVFLDKIRMNKPLRNILAVFILVGGFYAAALSAVMINRAYLSGPPEGDPLAVIVLGAKIRGDSPSLILRRRLDAAYDYMMINNLAVCVVTGGQGYDEIMPESVVMRNYLIKRGVPPGRILLEDKSENTRQNFEFAAVLIPQPSRAVIVTDGFHQLRASVYAKAAGIDAPYCISSNTPWGLLPAYWLRELAGIPVALWLAKY